MAEKINYKKMYLLLFNKITDALESMEKFNYGQSADILRMAQIEAEEIYINRKDRE